MQLSRPCFTAAVPASVKNFPGAQSTHADEFWPLHRPASHMLHASAASNEYLPLTHGLQALDGSRENCPPAQAAHSAEPAGETWC